MPEDTTGVIVNVQGNDNDIDGDPLTTTIIGGPTSGGSATVVNGDSLSYSPPANFVGVDTITYMVCDTAIVPLCDTAIVFITVNPVNDTIPKSTPQDSTLIVCADSLTTFSAGAATSVSICNTPSNGNASINGTCINYTPNTSFVGMDTLCLVSCNGAICDTTLVIITVTPVMILQ